MAEPTLRLIRGDSGDDRLGGAFWTPTGLRRAPSPSLLNLSHLRVVPPPAAPPLTLELVEPPAPEPINLLPPSPLETFTYAEPQPPAPTPEEQTSRIGELERELEASRDETEALHQMLEDLPEIFERKFRQRLQPVLEHQQRLISENQTLREGLLALSAARPSEPPQLPPAPAPATPVGLTARLRAFLRRARRF